MRRRANLETGVFPKRVASDSLLASSKLCFLPLAETLDCLIVWIVGNLRMCVFSQSVCALWPALSMAFMIVLSAMLWFLRPLGVPKHFVHGNSAKMVDEFTFLRKDQVHCPGCSDVVTGKRSNMFIQKSLPSFIFTAWISLADVLLIAESKSWFEAQLSNLPTGQLLPKGLHDTRRNRTAKGKFAQLPNYL